MVNLTYKIHDVYFMFGGCVLPWQHSIEYSQMHDVVHASPVHDYTYNVTVGEPGVQSGLYYYSGHYVRQSHLIIAVI